MGLTFEGKPLISTKKAAKELFEIGLDLYDVIFILENGFDLRKRAANVIEKAIIVHR